MRYSDRLWIGPVPPEERCTQVGDNDYMTLARAECNRYINVIRSKCGLEPEGAKLTIVTCPHDLGSYLEVAVDFDSGNANASEYAYSVENDGPLNWCDNGDPDGDVDHHCVCRECGRDFGVNVDK